MSFLQAVSIDSFDDLPQQRTEPLGNKSQFFIEGLLKDILIYRTLVGPWMAGRSPATTAKSRMSRLAQPRSCFAVPVSQVPEIIVPATQGRSELIRHRGHPRR